MLQRTAPARVYIADDSDLLCARIAVMLETAGLQVVGRAATPQAAIQGILGTRPDVVVLDIQLVGGTGLQVLHAVRQSAPGIAFVVFSSHSAPAYRKRYLDDGACAFLDKNTEFDQLARVAADAAHAGASTTPDNQEEPTP